MESPSGWYVKKPVAVEAIRYTGSNEAEVLFWVGFRVGQQRKPQQRKPQLPAEREAYFDDERGILIVRTFNGPVTLNPGDWVIHGVKGEFYPCDAEVFEATYEVKP